MSTYCIGDVQGCYDELTKLLDCINYDSRKDQLWFVGDLVNRGPKSLEVLRLVKSFPNTTVVLGNHDLHLLNFHHNIADFEIKHLQPILEAPDRFELIEWLRARPILHYSKNHNCVMVHAGIYPSWDLQEATTHAKEFEEALRSKNYISFLEAVYGDEPDTWDNSLRGYDRLRFITNAFTRMRFCDLKGKLEFTKTSGLDSALDNYLPWFKIPWRKTKNIKIIFGHWAALMGKTDESNAIGLDTGCVWGGSLTAYRLDDGVRFSIQALNAK